MVTARHSTVDIDVCVIGGGPAGLATALAARRHGLSVVLAERARPPIDKACGEGLMPDGIAALHELGIDPGVGTGVPFRGIRFLEADIAAEGKFSGRPGLGIRRIDLHGLLAEKALEAGVDLCWGASVESVGPSSVKIGGWVVRCRWIVGADGIQSRVRRWAGLPTAWSGSCRVGVRQHFRQRPWTDLVEVHWRGDAQAYVTPVAPDEVCVAVLGGTPSARLSDIVAGFPRLADRLGNAARVGSPRGAVSRSVRLRRVTKYPFTLIGDASGSVDAITGEGVSLALRQAVALGRALAAGDLGAYEASHRRMSRVPHLMARLLLFMGSHSLLRRSALETLAENPRTFDQLLAVHSGTNGVGRAAIGASRLALGLIWTRRIPADVARASGLPPAFDIERVADADGRLAVWRTPK